MNVNTETVLQGQILLNESLAEYTTWRVGGKAKRLYKPARLDDLSIFLKSLPPDEPLLWLGLGSNSLIRDTGFKGTVILTQGSLMNIQCQDENTIRVEAGVSCATMARFCARNHLAQGEFWAGIPGTMGGALRMNAGCFDGETWNHVIEVETMSRDGKLNKRSPSDYKISYRHVEGPKDEWFVAATCRLPKGQKETSLQVIKELLARRSETQPTSEYNCGSVFRNPPGNFAARLIESCGLKGMQIGKAQVSTKHANFIINQSGEAQASDIESLISLVQKTVSQEKQIDLIREVHIIGDN